MSNTINYPKVLLLEHQFDNKTGLGITLSNLFANWPKEQLAIMSPFLNIDLCETVRPCQEYIGGHTHSSIPNKTKSNPLRKKVRNLYYYMGCNELRYRFSYSIKDIERAQTFNPDIVFSCLGSLNSMKDCSTVLEYFPNAKLVLYIVDDWVNTKENNRFFSSYWRKTNDRWFRQLLDKATGLLSICPYMSEVYKSRYGRDFIPFHNPVDTLQWSSQPFTKRYDNSTKSILYVGKINDDTKGCLLDTASAIHELNKVESRNRFRFDVYTPNYSNNQDLFVGFPDCQVFPPVPHSDILELTKSYDALLLTLGFSKQSREYVRLSMPTKLSEYLAAGIPTILYCPEEIALAKYLVPKKCSINCLEKDINKLADAIKMLNDEPYCESIITKALELAKQHDVTLVRESFESTLQSFLK